MSELIKGQGYWPGLDHMTTSGIGVTGSILTKPSTWTGVTMEEGKNDIPKKKCWATKHLCNL